MTASDIAATIKQTDKRLQRLANVASNPAGPSQIGGGLDDIMIFMDELLTARSVIESRLRQRNLLAIGEEQVLIEHARDIDRQMRELSRVEQRLATLLLRTHRTTISQLSPIF